MRKPSGSAIWFLTLCRILQDMRFLSNLKQGYLPTLDHNDIEPTLLARYYGVEGQRRHRRPGQTGAGHYDDAQSSAEEALHPSTTNATSRSSDLDSSDSEDSEGDDIAERLAEDQQRHVRHPPIPVPNSASPFSEENEELFFKALHEIRMLEIIPENIGVSTAEWENGSYGDMETIPFGRGGRQEELELPFVVWWPRAVEWAQGLELMTAILMEQDEYAFEIRAIT